MDAERELSRLAERFVESCPSPALLVDAAGGLRTVNAAAAALLALTERGPRPAARDVLGIGWREISVMVRDAQADLVVDLPANAAFPARRGLRVRLEPVSHDGADPIAAVAFLDLSTPENRARPRAVDTLGFDALFGTDPTLVATKQAAARFARTPLPVLLLAETGTGKELLARAIHGASARRDRPFVAINCGALSPHLLESELFGYAPGAFTGASRDGNEGKIGAARGGTLFLDEVAEMPGPLQALLLRVLEDGTYYRVGESRPRQADVRLICATCRDLPRLVADGGFRQDLFYRINGACLVLPPLRARADVEALARHLLHTLCAEQGRAAPEISAQAMEFIVSMPWAGNTRQLRTALQYALILCDDAAIEVAHLPHDPASAAPPPLKAPAAGDADSARPAPEPAPVRTLAEREVEHLQTAVDRARGNLSRAAAELGIARSTLYRRLRRHGLVT